MKKVLISSGIIIILFSFIFFVLFTTFINTPMFIYIDSWKGKNIYQVNDVKEIDLRCGKNSDLFLNNLKYCKNLKNLTCDSQDFSDKSLKFLSGTSLNELMLINKGWQWSQLSECNTVETLSLVYSDFNNISLLSDMKNLHDLYIESDERIDLDNISDLTYLEKLTLYVPELDIREINTIYNLKTLYLNSKNISNLNDVVYLKNVESIHILNEQKNGVDLSIFLSMDKLRELYICNCKINNSKEEEEKYDELYSSVLNKYDRS